MEKWVRKKIKNCVPCYQKNGTCYSASVAPLKAIPVSPKIMWRIHVDMTGKLTVESNGKYKYFVLAVCAFSKYIEGDDNFIILICQRFFFIYILISHKVIPYQTFTKNIYRFIIHPWLVKLLTSNLLGKS